MSNAAHRTFVLVHSGFLGGFAWRDVLVRLRALGHTATAPTLTGLGERGIPAMTPLIWRPISRTLSRTSKWRVCETSLWLAGATAAWWSPGFSRASPSASKS